MVPSCLPLFRPAVSADAAAIAYVHVAASLSTYRGILPDEYLDELTIEDRAQKWEEILARSDQFVLVSEVENGGIVGFSNGGPERDGRTDFRGELYAIYLLDQWRGRGIGNALVRKTAATLLDRAIGDMLVWVLESNPYRRFYERLHGRPIDRKTVECAGQDMIVVAYGWKDLRSLAAD